MHVHRLICTQTTPGFQAKNLYIHYNNCMVVLFIPLSYHGLNPLTGISGSESPSDNHGIFGLIFSSVSLGAYILLINLKEVLCFRLLHDSNFIKSVA